MKKIPLTHGKFALVDDDDFDRLSKFKWHLTSHGYAAHAKHGAGGEKRWAIKMHRFIMNTPDGMDTDHINHDRLDNRKENLRICTKSENQWNNSRNPGKSGYRGVSMSGKKWTANIRAAGKRFYLGTFRTKDEAAIAWNEAAKKYHGEFAAVNALTEPELSVWQKQ